MDKQLHALMAQSVPKLNPDICNGLAVKHLPFVDQYVHDVMKASAAGFPAGLEYVGCSRCTPQEEFNAVTRMRNGKRNMDIARSDLYLMKYMFRFNGKDLEPRYLYLPFSTQAGTLMMGGSRFVVTPVLTDKVISPGQTNVFVRLLRDKITFEKQPHGMVIDDQREMINVVWALIYHMKASKRVKPTTKANSSMVHYMLCKYGFSEMMRRYGDCSVIVGDAEINTNAYPSDKYVICQSTRIKPKSFGRAFYTPTTIRVAVERDKFTPMVKNLIAGFFYVVDHFPDRMVSSWVDNARQWTILLGHILFSAVYSEGRLVDDALNHFRSLDEYIDTLVKVKLREIGLEVQTIYDLFAVVIANFNPWVLGSVEKVSSMYDKELSILYYILESINNAIFNLNFKLKAAAKKELKESDINNVFNSVLKQGLIFSITRQHISMSTISYSGDNKFLKITSMLVPQASANKKGSKKSKTGIDDPSKKLHASLIEVGGYACLPKSDPTGHSRINGFVKLDEKASVLRDPSKQELLDELQVMIRRQ